MEVATVGLAVSLDSAGGTCTGARIALGAVGPVVLRAPLAEARLSGSRLDAATVATEGHRSLLDALREKTGLTGTKKCCAVGDFRACTVILHGQPVHACLVNAVKAEGADILTIEGLQPGPDDLHPLQEAFMEHGASQCGFCTPGILIVAKCLLERNPLPSDDEIRWGLSGNICCGIGDTKIFDVIRSAGRRMAAAQAERQQARA